MKPMTTRVVVADDVDELRWMLRAVLNTDERFEVVGEAATGPEVIRVVDLTRPDVVVLDVRMPELDGHEAAVHLADAAPDTRIVFLTSVRRDEVRLAKCVASAPYVRKGASMRTILDAVAQAARDE
ncbi:MAG: response regulator transcription factor [Acidimicrobiia bacterium]|nr:response regulator transcription factor [Acidimicrobiia bacterium]